jgi:hypothetical protein
VQSLGAMPVLGQKGDVTQQPGAYIAHCSRHGLVGRGIGRRGE